MATPDVSHGRGGAGNINPDDTKYVDGEVVRAGEEGSHGTGAFSTGRGGGGNIADAGKKPGPRQDKDVVPEAAYRPSTEAADFHVGRGGAGNEHTAIDHEKKAAAKARAEGGNTSFADKLKAKILGGFSKKST